MFIILASILGMFRPINDWFNLHPDATMLMVALDAVFEVILLVMLFRA